MYITSNGYYLYNDKCFFTREEVLDEMLLNKDYDGSFEFKFNDEVYSELNWRVNTYPPLRQLYKIRAQQLRDKYDYLILSYSGGSDSTEVLETFLRNNIFIDEVQVLNFESLFSKARLSADLHYFLEYRLSAVSGLKRIKEFSPNTKITIIDASNFLFDQVVNNKFEMLGIGKDKMSVAVLTSSSARSTNYYMQRYNEKNTNKQNSCFIRGSEKPSLSIEDSKLYHSFYDISMNGYSYRTDPYQTELFFWSKDMPMIVPAQIQVLKTALENNKTFYNLFLHMQVLSKQHIIQKLKGYSPAVNLERMHSYFIYDHWGKNSFNSEKIIYKSPEFELIKSIAGRHSGYEVMTEKNNFYKNKYSLINNQYLLSKFKFGQRYYVGELQLNHDKDLNKSSVIMLNGKC